MLLSFLICFSAISNCKCHIFKYIFLRASNSGMLVLSSLVKTHVKKLSKVSALSLLSVLIDPDGASKFPTVSFVLDFDLI